MNEYMTPAAPAQTVTTVRTPEVVGAEVRNLTAAAKYLTVWYAVEIGRRLTEAKDLVGHGGWMDWLKRETEFSQPTANRFMRIFTEYGAEQSSLFGADTKYSTLNNLSVSNALRLLALPEEERETFALEVDAEHLSTRELEQAIRERDEAKKELDASEKLRTELADKVAGQNTEIAAAQQKIRELERRPIEVVVQEPDQAEVERRIKEATAQATKEKENAERLLAQEKEKAKATAEKLGEKLKAAEEKLASAGAEDKAAAEQLRATAEDLRKQLAMSDAGLVTFKLRFRIWQESYAAMQEALGDVPEAQREKCEAAVKAVLAGWGA